ncbi:hypothetical protein [Rhizobium sp. BK176]|uniref:hypothetical protein n=1 Tax=Rhizobium sp. BK176 TaxID=2587071 RepID=UPI002169FC54|nr:hypothetical protein [Rhizobium sp. BK176]MCS4090198.1 hypothetical protein [Rhizobium sp. BK176]
MGYEDRKKFEALCVKLALSAEQKAELEDFVERACQNAQSCGEGYDNIRFFKED